MPDILADDIRKTTERKIPDKKTGRLARILCEQCFQMNV
jgi:hypothetical protein